MIHVITRLKSVAVVAAAVALSVAGFAGAYLADGGSTDVMSAQTTGAPPPPAPPAMAGGAGTGPMGGGVMGPGMMMGPGMGGMGGGMGGGAGGGGGQAWIPGFGEPASTARLHDYAPTASSTFYQKEQWTALSERYELTMEWAHQLNRKWAPIEEAKLHYNLAAMGAAMMVPTEFQNVLNPMNIALEGRRLEQRAVDAYVEAQIARIPQEIKDNLLESARLAVLRKTRFRDPDNPEAEAESPAPAPAPASPPPAEAGAAAPAAATAPAAPAAPPPAPEVEIDLPPASIEQDRAEFDRRVQLEYESLLRSYVMGLGAGAWFRTDYYPRDRSYSDTGRPAMNSVAPPRVWSDAPAAATSSSSGGGMAGSMMMPGGPAMMGGPRGAAGPGARGGVSAPPGGGAGTGAPMAPMAAGVSSRPGS